MLLCVCRVGGRFQHTAKPRSLWSYQYPVFHVQEGRWMRNNLRENRAKDELQGKVLKREIFLLLLLKKFFSGTSFDLCHHSLPSMLCLHIFPLLAQQQVVLKLGIAELKHCFLMMPLQRVTRDLPVIACQAHSLLSWELLNGHQSHST